jgi:DNA polymerase-3 subunit gamma/tau
MAYLVLARKYRPQRFGEMSGQEHVVRTLRNALKTGQLAHAFLFTGPRGVGKTTTARLVAKALNCESGPTAEPCGTCAPCVEIAEGRAVDVVEIDAASNNGVDNVRDIVDAVKYRPARDRFKIFVIDEVHMLSQGAFNALLKTLEEPPPHVKFVLATTDVHRVPETIVSRCQRFEFKRLTVQQIAEQLGRVAEAEGMRLSPLALALVARAAEGGMRDALSILDQVRAACGEAPSDEEVGEALGAVDVAAVGRLCAALVARDGAAVLAEIAALDARGLETRRVAEEVVRHLRDVLVARLVPTAPLDLPDAEVAEVRALAAAAEPAQLTRLFDLAQRAVADVKLADQPRFALEIALLKGVFLAPGADVTELLARVEALSGGRAPPGSGGGGTGRGPAPRPAAPAAPAPAPAPAKPTAPPPARTAPAAPSSSAPPAPTAPAPAPSDPAASPVDDPAAPLAERWRAAVEQVEKVSPAAVPALRQAALLWIREGEVGLQLPRGLGAASAERRRGEIESALARHFGRPTRLAITLGEPPVPEAVAAPSLAASDAAERSARSARVRDAAAAHPNIRTAAEILGGDVGRTEEL